MYTVRERLWIDMSDMFFDSSAHYTAAPKIAGYCDYDLDVIETIFFQEVAPVCERFTGVLDRESINPDVLVDLVYKMLDSGLSKFYNTLYNFKKLKSEYRELWTKFETELKTCRNMK